MPVMAHPVEGRERVDEQRRLTGCRKLNVKHWKAHIDFAPDMARHYKIRELDRIVLKRRK